MKDLHPDIIELLVVRSTEGLDEEQERKLQALLDEQGIDDTLEFDLAAAAAGNAFALKQTREYEKAPAALRAKLLTDADRFFGDATADVVGLRRPPTRSGWNWGWAAAAALALALVMTNVGNFGPGVPDYEEARRQLIANSNTSRIIPWAPPQDPAYAGVTGDVVWDDERQEGYMLLSGMPANDPRRSQYQLWLVDPERDTNPVDGGVFDIPANRESVVIPIDAKLAVSNPSVFAITREQPGGVVVSKGPLLVVASAG
jgi:hypothetical protein